MATNLIVRNVDADLVKALKERAAQKGISAEAEHREILRATLIAGSQSEARQQAAERLADFRRRTGGRNSSTSTELLSESRGERLRFLTGDDPG